MQNSVFEVLTFSWAWVNGLLVQFALKGEKFASLWLEAVNAIPRKNRDLKKKTIRVVNEKY